MLGLGTLMFIVAAAMLATLVFPDRKSIGGSQPITTGISPS
jgi:hypothetical protein